MTLPQNIHTAFTEQYHALRLQEQRICTDAELLRLPDVQRSHPHYKEWKIRKRSAQQLCRTIEKSSNGILSVLDAGCGNGWLSAQMARIPGVTVTGIDIHGPEIEQAQRVFGGIHNLQFVLASPFEEKLAPQSFDCVVFAASVQYFPSFDQLMRCCMQLLRPGGEIHILDTHFYSEAEAAAAAVRTLNYYRQLGFEEMADYYFQRATKELEKYPHRFIAPEFFMDRFFSPDTKRYFLTSSYPATPDQPVTISHLAAVPHAAFTQDQRLAGGDSDAAQCLQLPLCDV